MFGSNLDQMWNLKRYSTGIYDIEIHYELSLASFISKEKPRNSGYLLPVSAKRLEYQRYFLHKKYILTHHPSARRLPPLKPLRMHLHAYMLFSFDMAPDCCCTHDRYVAIAALHFLTSAGLNCSVRWLNNFSALAKVISSSDLADRGKARCKNFMPM